MDKHELMRHIGSIEQIGGIKSYTYNEGKARGSRGIEINTGLLRFIVLPDRCMDIGQAYYKETALSWLSKTGITASCYYEKDGKNWLRGFYGGLVTTCGLKNIGKPVDDHGLHGRIANTPAQKISVFADWVGERYVMTVSGEMRESVVFGENLILKRRITTELFSNEINIEDTIVNEGFSDEKIALCYHCNFGYPLVREGAKIINVPDKAAHLSAPTHGKKEECIDVSHTGELATAGIENGDIGAYLTYKRDTLPDFLIWKMLGESEYVVGLEPRTTSLGGIDIAENNKYVTLKAFEEYHTFLKFEVSDIE